MGTTREEIRSWLESGIANKAEFMIVAADTFEYEDYPVFCNREDVRKEYERLGEQSFTKVMEVYDMALDIDMQLSEHRAFHFPA